MEHPLAATDRQSSVGHRWARGQQEDQQRLHRLLESGSCALLRHAGLTEGMRIADVGCGIGLMTLRLAEEVGPAGLVVGLGEDDEQLARARDTARHEGRRNLWFEKASPYNTGLPRSTFGIVYARCLFSRLDRPWDALGELISLLEPGGVLVCEELETAPAPPVTLPWRLADDMTSERGSGLPAPGAAVAARLPLACMRAGLAHVGTTFAELGPVLPPSPRGLSPRVPPGLALWQVWARRPLST